MTKLWVRSQPVLHLSQLPQSTVKDFSWCWTEQSEQTVLPKRLDAHSLLLPLLLIFLLSRVIHWKLTWHVAWVLFQTCPIYPGTSLAIMDYWGFFGDHVGSLWWSSQECCISTLSCGPVISNSLCYWLFCCIAASQGKLGQLKDGFGQDYTTDDCAERRGQV